MFEIRENKGRYIGITLTGKMKNSDYDRLAPFLERKIEEHRNLRVMFEFKDYEGMTLEGYWRDFKEWMRHRDHFEKLAFVGPKETVVTYAWFSEIFSDSITEFFGEGDTDSAWKWLHADDSIEYDSWATMPFTRVDSSENAEKG